MKFKDALLPALLLTLFTAPDTRAQGGPPGAPPATIPEEPDAVATPMPSMPVPAPQAPAPARPVRTVTPVPTPAGNDALVSFKFEGADLETVMAQYCEWTGKIYLKTDTVTATITLKADKLTKEESIEVVEAILAMNNIALLPMGDKFIKVVQTTAPDLVGQGMQVNLDAGKGYTGNEKLATQLIQLKHVQIPEVQTAIQHLMHAFGKIQTLESSNSMLVTDTEANILRIRELVEFLDQPAAGIEPLIREIKYAEAGEIAAKLGEIISIAQETDKKATAGSSAGARTPPGVIRARTPQQPAAATPTRATISSTESGGAPILQGSVKVMADERTNLIIIFSQKENFDFFDKIIKVLDVEVKPAITFEVVQLEYADAEELAGTLNELVGAAQGGTTRSGVSSSSRSSTRSTSSSASRSRTTGSSSSRSSVSAPSPVGGGGAQVTPNAEPEEGTAAIENLSKLSENTKILADIRSNSILLMGRESDIAAIKNVIKNLDIMLEQVLIEAAIFEVTLGDSLRHGIDWLYRSQGLDKVGAWDGVNLIASNALQSVASGALTYYQNLKGINTEIAINLAASDSNVRLLATPVVMTTDNTEARLSVGEQRPVVTSTDSYGNSSGTLRSSYEYKDIGIQLTVTPRINPQRVVVMEILQQADQVGDEVSIDNNKVPVILNREFEAAIAVPDRGTIALGGLINTETRDTVSKIPILGDIPLLGRYLFSSVNKENRQTELVVLLTPYVLTNHDEMTKETERLYDSTDMQPGDWPSKGWSGSHLQHREKPMDEGAE